MGIDKHIMPQVLAYFGLIVFNEKLENKFKPELDNAVSLLLEKSLFEEYGYHCWNSLGFPLQMRNSYSPSDIPDVVGGSLIGLFFLEYHKRYNSKIILEVLESQYSFFLNELFVPIGSDEAFIRYRPTQPNHKATYNASLLACNFLIQVGTYLNKRDHEKIKKCYNFVLNHQKITGEWFYTIDLKTQSEKKQVDFHQGFILDCILLFMEQYGFKEPYLSAYERGLSFYYKKQFLDTGQGIYRYPKKYPINIHNQSQGIITFAKASCIDMKYLQFARVIKKWTLANMFDFKKEYFYYLKFPVIKYDIPYIRWSDSNMFLALSTLKNIEANI